MTEGIENKWISEGEFIKIRGNDLLRGSFSSVMREAESKISRTATETPRQQLLSEAARAGFTLESSRAGEVINGREAMQYRYAIMVFRALDTLLKKRGFKGLTRDDLLGEDYLSSEAMAEYVHDPETAETLEATGAFETYGFRRHVGRIIELKRFFSFSDILDDHSGGVPPKRCALRRTLGSTDDWSSLSSVDRKGNLTKYQLFDYFPRSLDEGVDLKELRFKSYKHREYIAYLNAGLLDDQKRRISEGNPDPLHNRIPNPFGVHAIVAFDDLKTFLCLQRRADVAYEGGTISFGLEEQLDNSDFSSTSTANLDHLINRLVLEEVFPAAFLGQNSKKGREIINNSVSFKKIISLVYAENYCCHNAVAFIKLKFSPTEYVEYFKELSKLDLHEFQPTFEDEGRRLCMSMEEVHRFMDTGRGSLKGLFQRKQVELVIDKLIENSAETEFRPHVSTVYRMKLTRELLG